MKAIVLVPGTARLHLDDRPEPSLSAPDDVKVRVLQVGICGTDREQASGGRAEAPPGESELVVGHEMLGMVVAVGPGVSVVKPGDYGVFTVRRGCGRCAACAVDRSDMCYSGNYTERGIKGRDGYLAEYVVDRERYVVKIPPAISPFGVLAEPMSVVEKAIDEATKIQSWRLPDVTDRRPWLNGKQTLVAGLGSLGLLAAFALRLRGANVLGLSTADAGSIRPSILSRIGGTYVDGRRTTAAALGDQVGQIDLVLDATGVAPLEFDLLNALGTNGVYVLTGIPGGDRPTELDAASLVRRLVLRNQVMLGSVNASCMHFQSAVDDLARAHRTWGDTIERIITHRLPYTRFADALSQHPEDEIKTVLEWGAV